MSRSAMELEVHQAEFKLEHIDDKSERVVLAITMDEETMIVELFVSGVEPEDASLAPFCERHDMTTGWELVKATIMKLIMQEFVVTQFDLPIRRSLGSIRLRPPPLKLISTEYASVIASHGPPWMIQEVVDGELVHIARKDGGLHIYDRHGQEVSREKQLNRLRAFFLHQDRLDPIGNFTLGAVLPREGTIIIHDILYWQPDFAVDGLGGSSEKRPVGDLKAIRLRERGVILRKFRAAIGSVEADGFLIRPPMPVGAGRDAIERILACGGDNRIFLRHGEGLVRDYPLLEAAIFIIRNDHP